MSQSSIYLDYASATPVDEAVLAAMQPYWQVEFYNPSALYAPARAVKLALNQARSDIANLLGAQSSEIYFTAGATESINLAIGGILRRFPGKTVAISQIEHQSLQAAAAGFTTKINQLAVDKTGRVLVQELANYIDEHTVLVSIGHGNSEIGTLQPLQRIGQVIARIRTQRQQAGNRLPLYFHTDASQTANYLDLQVQRLGVDMMTLNGGKLYGPKQSGALYVGKKVDLLPVFFGGGQEKGLRGGTENVAFCVGFAAALKLAQSKRKTESARQLSLQQELITGLLEIEGAKLNGHQTYRLPGNINFSFPGINGEMLIHHLDAAGIMASTGAACSASTDNPSHVLQAIGCNESECAGSLRLSLGRETTKTEIELAIKTLKFLVPKLRSSR